MGKFQILFLFLMLVFVSCTTSSLEEFVVGKNFVKDQAGIVKIDTLTLKSSVVKYDSIISNSSGRFLVGSNYNDFSGYKNSSSFFTMKFDGSIDNTKFVYDSLCMVLSYDRYFSGDTTVTQTLGVYQLKEVMELNNGYLYTTSKFANYPTPLGTKSFKPRPHSLEQINIRLSDRLGNRIAQMIKAKKDTITSRDLFTKYFLNGIVLKSDPNVKGSIIGFRTADVSSSSTNSSSSSQKNKEKLKPEIRLYYHLSPNPSELKDLYYKFSFASDGIYFNQISGDSRGSSIDGIESSKNEMNSSLTNNQVIVQSGILTFTKFKIPYLDNLAKSSSNPAVVGAIIKLYPVKGTYSDATNLPDSLFIYKADKKNSLIGQVTLPGTTDKYVYGILAKNAFGKITKDDKDRVYYEADVSAFIEAELAEQLETTNSLFIGYGSTKSKKTAEHVILGGVNSGKYSPALSVFYYHN